MMADPTALNNAPPMPCMQVPMPMSRLVRTLNQLLTSTGTTRYTSTESDAPMHALAT